MDNAAFLGKKEQLDAVEELLAHRGYAILVKEIERQRGVGIAQCCDTRKPQTVRDAGAGIKGLADDLLEYLPRLKRSLEQTINQEKSRRSRNRQKQ